MVSNAESPAPEGIGAIATVRVELNETDPLIWREVDVTTSVTLKSLHEIIQALMGWEDYHLWEFAIAEQRFGPPSGKDWHNPPLVDAAKTCLRDVLKPRKTSIDYLYDFGDSWELGVIVTGVRPGEPGIVYPRYIAGEQNAPPEDCGGIPGFYDKLDIIADPKNPDHDDIVEWMGEYDPEAVDETGIKARLARIANRRKTGTRRASKKPKSGD